MFNLVWSHGFGHQFWRRHLRRSLIKLRKSTALNKCEKLPGSLSDLTVKMAEFVRLWVERDRTIWQLVLWWKLKLSAERWQPTKWGVWRRKFSPLKPSGRCVCTTKFNAVNSAIRLHSVFLCSLWFSQYTTVTFPTQRSVIVLIVQQHCIPCELTNWLFMNISFGFSRKRLNDDTVDNRLRLYGVWSVVAAIFRATVRIWVDVKGGNFYLIGALFRNLPGIRKTTKLQGSRFSFEIRTGYHQSMCIALPLRRCSEF